LLAALTASFIAAPSTLNAARQSGGALGVAVLGSLLGHGPELSLHVPLLVATAGYLIAIALALGTIRRRPHHAPDSG
jgi:DHA2 family methylenomycin A resistance protein-like MFS transporter